MNPSKIPPKHNSTYSTDSNKVKNVDSKTPHIKLFKNSLISPLNLKERDSNYSINSSSNEGNSYKPIHVKKSPRSSSNATANLKEAIKNKIRSNSELAEVNSAYPHYSKSREVSINRHSVEDSSFTTTSTQQLKTSRVTVKSSNEINEIYRNTEESSHSKKSSVIKRPTSTSVNSSNNGNNGNNENDRYEEAVPHTNTLFKRFYDKFSNNVEKTLHNKGKEEIDLIGNHRFNHGNIEDFLKEKDHLYNKFNPQYQQDISDLRKLSVHTGDQNEHELLMRVYKEKKQEIMSKIELTPLPIHKKSLSKENQDEVQKAERSAVLMRRYEYEMNLQKKKNEAKAKAVARKKQKDQTYKNEDTLYFEDEINNIGIKNVTDFDETMKTEEELNLEEARKDDKFREDFLLDEEKRKRDLNEVMRSSFNKDYYQLINWNASIIQNKYRKFIHKKKIEMRFILGKIITIQKSWRNYVNWKKWFNDYLLSLEIESEGFEVIDNVYYFNKGKNPISKFNSNLVNKPLYASDISKKQYSINLTTQNCYLSNPIIKEIVVNPHPIAEKFYYATKVYLTPQDQITLNNFLNNFQASSEVVFEILKDDKRKISQIIFQTNLEILPIMKTNINKVTSETNLEILQKRNVDRVVESQSVFEILTKKVLTIEIISLTNLEILSVKKKAINEQVSQLQVEIPAIKRVHVFENIISESNLEILPIIKRKEITPQCLQIEILASTRIHKHIQIDQQHVFSTIPERKVKTFSENKTVISEIPENFSFSGINKNKFNEVKPQENNLEILSLPKSFKGILTQTVIEITTNALVKPKISLETNKETNLEIISLGRTLGKDISISQFNYEILLKKEKPINQIHSEINYQVVTEKLPKIKLVRQPFYTEISRSAEPSKTIEKAQNKIREFLINKKQKVFNERIISYFNPLLIAFRKLISSTFKTKTNLKIYVRIKKILEAQEEKNQKKDPVNYYFKKWKESSFDPNCDKYASTYTIKQSDLNITTNKINFISKAVLQVEVVKSNTQKKEDFYKSFSNYIVKKLSYNFNEYHKKSSYLLLKDNNSNNVHREPYLTNDTTKITSLENRYAIKKLHFEFCSSKFHYNITTAQKGSFANEVDYYIRGLVPFFNKISINNRLRLLNYSFKKIKYVTRVKKFVSSLTNIFDSKFKLMFVNRLFNSIREEHTYKLPNKLVRILTRKYQMRFFLNCLLKALSKGKYKNKSIILANILEESANNQFLSKKTINYNEKNVNNIQNIENIQNKYCEKRNIFNFIEENSEFIKGNDELCLSNELNFVIDGVFTEIPRTNTDNTKSAENEFLKFSSQWNPFRGGHYLVSRNETITLSEYEDNHYTKNTHCNTSNINII